MSLFSVVTLEGGGFELHFDASADIAVSGVVRMLGEADAKARYDVVWAASDSCQGASNSPKGGTAGAN